LALGQWDLAQGDEAWLRLGFISPTPERAHTDGASLAAAGERALFTTTHFWRSWLRRDETGREIRTGPYEGLVQRSALALKLMFHAPEGTFAAAATTSLPEEIGGVRNWDYRFTWIRDTSFTLQALFNLGHLSETEGYLRWIERLLAGRGPEDLQIMYGLRGEEDLTEQELPHLDGYKGSRPVRVGNGAARQRQLDIYGEVLDAALALSDYVGKIDAQLWPALRAICDYVTRIWREKDAGIWEVRGGERHFVYSKLMCWVALDRGVTISERYGFPADTNHWLACMNEIREEVYVRGWCEEKQSFTQHYETTALDASVLRMFLLGFLPCTHPRAVSTILAVQRELTHDGLVLRYSLDQTSDGLAGGEGYFLLCSFWLADCLVLMDKLDEAERVLQRVAATANHLGLFAEEWDPAWKELLGNFPQAFTHIGFINTAHRLMQAKDARKRHPKAPPKRFLSELRHKLLMPAVTLNRGHRVSSLSSGELVAQLKKTMNQLRGAFFDSTSGRVAYERMRNSDLYLRYLDYARNLRDFHPETLTGREEKIAFWINLYNVLVIHGVIELGIRDSVKEVRGFFRRARYDIGGHLYAPDDIEHGILRGNRKPPGAIMRRFGEGDPRMALSHEQVDPRVHFGLVCASRSCPPIDVYTPERLDEQLDVAARTFLSSGGALLDRQSETVRLSRVFRWYAEDFPNSQDELLHFVAGYLHDQEDASFIREHANELMVEYQKYDWRLNR
ncbi:glycoside hydrolase family 15 protein, partial [Desulfocurvibacter africanus]|uniref:glycoside hydrolase family 15 protein n=1 Tax=Desulfocurvibacter africanus TaxID=873 RepID=UPI002FD8FBE9